MGRFSVIYVQSPIAWHNAGPHTIWGRLAFKLGREPTDAEARAEVERILADARDNKVGRAARAVKRTAK